MKDFVNSKWMIVIEIGLCIFFLLGANIFGFIPVSETPFIVLLAWISLLLRRFREAGLFKSKRVIERPQNARIC